MPALTIRLATCMAITAVFTATGVQAKIQTLFESDGVNAPRLQLETQGAHSDQIKAIVAMIAFQFTPKDCEGPREALQCAIPTALNLGTQCSDAHIALVQKWFPHSMPKMSGYGPQHYSGYTPDDFPRWMCAMTPDGASVQANVRRITLERRKNTATFHVSTSWMSRELSGAINHVLKFDLSGKHIRLVSHKKSENALD